MVLKEDALLKKLMAYLWQKYDGRYHQHIRQKAREMSKVLLCIRKNNLELSRTPLLDLLQPKFFDQFIHAVKEIATEGEKETLSFPLKVGHTLRKLLVIAKGIAIRTQNSNLRENLEMFSDLMMSDWTDLVASKWHKKLKDAHMNKTLELPSTDDMMTLDRVVKSEMNELLGPFKTSPGLEIGRKLLEALLISIVLFNKR